MRKLRNLLSASVNSVVLPTPVQLGHQLRRVDRGESVSSAAASKVMCSRLTMVPSSGSHADLPMAGRLFCWLPLVKKRETERCEY
jgi:hypothetical protein